jgi:hypothetical protein
MSEEANVDETETEAPVEEIDALEVETEPETVEEEGDTFPRSYVEKLRRESAGYRDRAQKGDTYAQLLHNEMVRATGRLADPTDLAFDEAHLDDPDALAAAVDELLARKPHLASRRPMGDIGQGASASAGTVDLAAILRGRAG